MAERAKGLVIADDCLAEVANKPLLIYGLDAMRSAGIREVAIVPDRRTVDAIRGVVDGLGGDMRVRFAESLAAAGPLLGDSPCVAQVRDGLVRGHLRPLVEELVRDDLDPLVLLAPDGETLTSLDDQRLLRLAGGETSDCLAGLHVLGPRLVREAARGGSLAQLLDRVVPGGGRARTRCFEGVWKQVER